MKCGRIGCANKFKGSQSALVHVYDERKVMTTSGDYIGKYDPSLAEQYEGHKERWCAKCVQAYEPHKYLLTYYVEGRRLKQRRTRRKEIDKSVNLAALDSLAPIVSDVITIDEPISEVKTKRKKVASVDSEVA